MKKNFEIYYGNKLLTRVKEDTKEVADLMQKLTVRETSPVDSLIGWLYEIYQIADETCPFHPELKCEKCVYCRENNHCIFREKDVTLEHVKAETKEIFGIE